VECGKDHYSVLILSGFETDLGSVPRVLWNLFPPHEFSLEYVVHDWLYASESVPRNIADWILLEQLSEQTNWVKRNLVYSVVRAWGWRKWSKHTPESIAHARKFGMCLNAH
jgi:hypothetical protein